MLSRRKIQELKHAIRDDFDLARERRGWLEEERGQQVVYFIQIAGKLDSPIKIGFSTEGGLEDRLLALQTGNPYRLRILATMPGGQEVEARLHESFEHVRMMGEWFEASPALLALIDGLPNCVRLDTPEETG